MIGLIGIVVVAVGFALRINTLLVVVAAGIATGLVAGVPFNEIVGQFGKLFVENRYVTLPALLMLPVIGLLERHGLRERAEALIKQAKGATAGRVLLLYTAIRQISISLGVNIGGHAGMVRPLVAPMAEGAAHARLGALPGKAIERIRAHAAAAENVGNFFGEDTIFAVSSVLLISGVLKGEGHDVSLWAISLWGMPTAVAAFGLMGWRIRALDRRLAREAAQPSARRATPQPHE